MKSGSFILTSANVFLVPIRVICLPIAPDSRSVISFRSFFTLNSTSNSSLLESRPLGLLLNGEDVEYFLCGSQTTELRARSKPISGARKGRCPAIAGVNLGIDSVSHHSWGSLPRVLGMSHCYISPTLAGKTFGSSSMILVSHIHYQTGPRLSPHPFQLTVLLSNSRLLFCLRYI